MHKLHKSMVKMYLTVLIWKRRKKLIGDILGPDIPDPWFCLLVASRHISYCLPLPTWTYTDAHMDDILLSLRNKKYSVTLAKSFLTKLVLKDFLCPGDDAEEAKAQDETM